MPRMLAEIGGEMTNTKHEATEVSKYSPSEHGSKGTVNFTYRADGCLERISATKNAVVIQVFDELRFDDGTLRTVTHVECKDMALKDELLAIARHVVNAIKKDV